ncbi:MAG: hypothetical protein Q7S34_02095 [bacterium]|nr:hypothetical protein [bacterium]
MYSISNSFLLYLNEKAPSLFWQLLLDNLSFRWKIPQEECLMGWTSPKSGIDIIKELRTDEICGFAGIHFPGKEFMYGLVNLNPGPYTAIKVIRTLQDFLVRNNEGLGNHYDLIRLKAEEASNQGCVLKYATDETEQPTVLTRENFFTLFPNRIVH